MLRSAVRVSSVYYENYDICIINVFLFFKYTYKESILNHPIHTLQNILTILKIDKCQKTTDQYFRWNLDTIHCNYNIIQQRAFYSKSVHGRTQNLHNIFRLKYLQIWIT